MSSRILPRSGGGPAEVMAWRPAGSAPQAQPEPESPPPVVESPKPDLTAIYEQRIRELESAAAARVDEARRAAFVQGEASGKEQAGKQLAPVIEKLARSIEELAGLRARLRKTAEEDVVKLSLAIARRILRRELTVDPDALLGLVKAAVEKIDVRETSSVRLHPHDAEHLRGSLDRIGLPVAVKVLADPALERGAVLFETSRGQMDASVDTQLEEIGRGFSDLLEGRRS